MPFKLTIISLMDPDYIIKRDLPSEGVNICRPVYSNISNPISTIMPISRLINQEGLDRNRMGITYVENTIKGAYSDTIYIDHKSISEKQCLIKPIKKENKRFGLFKPKISLEDILEIENSSRYGTIVNGKRIEQSIQLSEHPIKGVIELGDIEFFFNTENKKMSGYTYTIIVEEYQDK